MDKLREGKNVAVIARKLGIAEATGMLLIRGTGNGERGTGNGEPGTGNRERESGNKCTAATLLRVQNGGQDKRKGSNRNNLG